MPCRDMECFCHVAEVYFVSWRQTLTLEKMLPIWQNWETFNECFWKQFSSFCQGLRFLTLCYIEIKATKQRFAHKHARQFAPREIPMCGCTVHNSSQDLTSWIWKSDHTGLLRVTTERKPALGVIRINFVWESDNSARNQKTSDFWVKHKIILGHCHKNCDLIQNY